MVVGAGDHDDDAIQMEEADLHSIAPEVADLVDKVVRWEPGCWEVLLLLWVSFQLQLFEVLSSNRQLMQHKQEVNGHS